MPRGVYRRTAAHREAIANGIERSQRISRVKSRNGRPVYEAGYEPGWWYSDQFAKQRGRCVVCGRAPRRGRPLVQGVVTSYGRSWVAGLTCDACSSLISETERSNGGTRDERAVAYVRGWLDKINQERERVRIQFVEERSSEEVTVQP